MPQALRTALRMARYLVGRPPAGRNLTVFPDDVFITSFPRSGNTWTRFLIGNLIHQESPVTFNNVESRIPEIYGNSDQAMRRLPRPRMLKSHESFDARYARVIYVVRDPRDVAVSKYHYNIATGTHPAGYPIEDFVPRFIAGEFHSMWGTWADHVMSWLSLRTNGTGFLLVKYEDLKLETKTTLERIAAFLKRWSFPALDLSPQKIERAIQLSSPERMRSLERQQGYRWLRLRKEREIKGYVAVRAAVSGGWRSILPPECVAQIESAWGSLMTRLSYPLVTVPVAAAKITQIAPPVSAVNC
jgi:Sulfotransferase domain